jgi:hypothetical protein
MIRKLVTIAILGVVLAVAGCRNPDDRRTTPVSDPATP